MYKEKFITKLLIPAGVVTGVVTFGLLVIYAAKCSAKRESFLREECRRGNQLACTDLLLDEMRYEHVLASLHRLTTR